MPLPLKNTTTVKMPIYATSATWAHLTYTEALNRLESTADPFLGAISMDKVQLCPQNQGFNDLASIMRLVESYPDTKFRLHADVKVVGRKSKADLCWYDEQNISNWKCIADISNAIKAECYSMHAGEAVCTLDEMFLKHEQLQKLFNCPVAIEGHYPTGKKYLLHNWDEHRILLESGIGFVVDLSHFNIIAKRYGWDENLVIDMLSNKNCLEVHVSDNEGITDSHQPIQTEPYWWKFVKHTTADIFYEGNHSIIELRKNNPNWYRK